MRARIDNELLEFREHFLLSHLPCFGPFTSAHRKES
jgi:hypothetical protein